MLRIRAFHFTAACALAMVGVAAASAATPPGRTLHMIVSNTEIPTAASGARRLAELVRTKSRGRLTIELVASPPANTLKSVQQGEHDLIAVTTRRLAPGVTEFAALDLPYLFRDSREADAILDGPIGRQLLERLSGAGLVGLAFWDGGFSDLATRRAAVNAPADIRSLAIGITGSPIHADVVRAWGGQPAALSRDELAQSLARDSIDGWEADVVTFAGAPKGDARRHVALTKHAYNAIALIVSQKTWDSLSDHDRAILRDAAKEATAFQRQRSRDESRRAIEAMKKTGAHVSAPDAPALSKFRESAAPVVDKYTIVIGREFVEELSDELRRVRSGS